MSLVSAIVPTGGLPFTVEMSGTTPVAWSPMYRPRYREAVPSLAVIARPKNPGVLAVIARLLPAATMSTSAGLLATTV